MVRGAIVDGIILGADLVRFAPGYRAYLATTGTNIQWIKILSASDDSCPKILTDLFKLCPNVKTVELVAGRTNNEKWEDCLQTLFESCPLLHSLSLGYFGYSAGIMQHARSLCKNLHSLTIRNSIGELSTDVALPSLTYLDLTKSAATDDILLAIGRGCPLLKTLHMFQGSALGPPVESEWTVRSLLHGCPQLREIDLEHTATLKPAIRILLAKRCDLTFLRPANWQGTFDEEFMCELLPVCPNLRVLEGGKQPWLTDFTLQVCARHCPLLRQLDLAYSNEVTAEGLLQLIKPGNQLRTIILRGCWLVDDVVLQAIAQHCPLLEHLNISYLTRITTEEVLQVIRRCSGLRELHLDDNNQIGEEVVWGVAEHCPLLETVNCNAMPLTDDAVARLAQRCPRLKAAHVNCRAVSDIGALALFQHCRDLVTLECRTLSDDGLRTLLRGLERAKLKELYVHCWVDNEGLLTQLEARGVGVYWKG